MMGKNNKISLFLKLAVGLAVILGPLFWFSSHAFIEINVGNGDNTELTYNILNQPGEKSTKKTTRNPKINMLVAKGSYEVLVTQADKSYFTVVKTGGFLSKSRISAALSPEKLRSFVGDNPAPCIYYNGTLYSYQCGGGFSTINKHVPASAMMPTYVEKNISTAGGLIEGLVTTSEGTVALLHQVDIEGPGAHVAYSLDSDLRPLKQMVLNGLTNTDTYSIASYKKGFLAYSSNFNQLSYYESLSAAAQEISIEKPGNAALMPQSLNVNGDYISIVYSNLSKDTLDSSKVNDKAMNEVVVYGGGNVRHFDYNGRRISAVTVCGQTQICVLSNKTMSVYQAGSKNNSRIYSIGKVNDMQTVGDSLLLVRDKEILSLNTASVNGYVDFSFGDYRYCGLRRIDSGKYVLCLSEDNGKETALLIDHSADNKDNIDKKIQKLKKMPSVSDVSIYGTHIFVAPNLGELVYDESLKSYNYDSATQSRVNSLIDKEIDSLGIDRNNYTIKNTSQ